MRFKILLNGREEEIEVIRVGEHLRVSFGDQQFDAQLIHTDGAHFVLEVEVPGEDDFVYRKRIRAAGYRDKDERQLWANGQLVNYRLVREGETEPADDDISSLSASIPAVVSEVLVNVGDRVASGDKLILLESMKMILPIFAPYDGFVSALHCEPADAVAPGIQLVEIEPLSENKESSEHEGQ